MNIGEKYNLTVTGWYKIQIAKSTVQCYFGTVFCTCDKDMTEKKQNMSCGGDSFPLALRIALYLPV